MKHPKKNKKIITDEIVNNLTVDQLYDLHQQGWREENPTKDWHDLMPKPRQPAQHDSYVASVGLQPSEGDKKLDEARRDPELGKMASQLGVKPDDLLRFREMMLNRYGHHYSDTEDTEWSE
jgi:hypothetical protein